MLKGEECYDKSCAFLSRDRVPSPNEWLVTFTSENELAYACALWVRSRFPSQSLMHVRKIYSGQGRASLQERSKRVSEASSFRWYRIMAMVKHRDCTLTQIPDNYEIYWPNEPILSELILTRLNPLFLFITINPGFSLFYLLNFSWILKRLAGPTIYPLLPIAYALIQNIQRLQTKFGVYFALFIRRTNCYSEGKASLSGKRLFVHEKKRFYPKLELHLPLRSFSAP